MDKNIYENIRVKEKWIRGIIMMFFIIVKHIITGLFWAIALFQFVNNLLFNESNNKLLIFSHRMNVYLFQIVNYLTYNSNVKPFPFSNWPSDE